MWGKMFLLILSVSVRRYVLTIRRRCSSLIVFFEVLLPLGVGAEDPGGRVAPGGVAAPFAREKEHVDPPVFHHVKLAVRYGHAEGAGECIYVPPPNSAYEPCPCGPAPVTPAPVRGRLLGVVAPVPPPAAAEAVVPGNR